MGSNRYNQRGNNPERGNKIPDYTPKEERKKVEEVTLTFESCCVCGNNISQGPYGRWGTGGTCSGKCEREMQMKPRDWGEPK